jgi:hypothetical protein
MLFANGPDAAGPSLPKTMKHHLLALALALPALACTAEVASEAPAPATSAEPVALTASTHEVRCGCGIDSIKKCGNYVDVDGTWAQIANPADFGLGKMEWCGEKGHKVEATVAGTVTGNSIELTQLEVQTHEH